MSRVRKLKDGHPQTACNKHSTRAVSGRLFTFGGIL